MPKYNEKDNKGSDDLADFKLPFPPRITALEVVSLNKKKGKKPSKSSNAFMIYRKVFSKEVAKNHRFQQKRISPICGDFWRREPEHVKYEYHKLAKEVDKLFLQLREETSLQDRIEWNMKADPQITLQRLEQPFPSNEPGPSIEYYLKEFDNLDHNSCIPDPCDSYENFELNYPIAPIYPNVNLPLVEDPTFNPYYDWNLAQYGLAQYESQLPSYEIFPEL
ncbi:17856_t:CDS:1 [Funneliformis caledonium]|uniref:17856_t:CDS:1 n=1 Tax=Funneliformis caledonium TaxID=1117310 RepID=A0A9N8VBP7_9GLOM|nr:17856_t:CDS:1 [Funneliformis caledonium]